MTDVPELHTLQQARDLVRSHRDDGIQCPCCDRWVQVYRRSITRSQVRFLAQLFKLARRKAAATDVALVNIPVDVREIEGQHMRGGDYAKLSLWGLIYRSVEAPGHWYITPKGIGWLQGDISVDRYAHVIDNELIAYSGPRWSVHDAYREIFRLQDIY